VRELVETVIEGSQVTQLGWLLLAQLLEPLGERGFPVAGDLSNRPGKRWR
jgi:hypothetical protein